MSRNGKPYDNAKAESFMKNAEVGRRLSRSDRGARWHQPFPGADLEPEAAALGAGVSFARRIRVLAASRAGRRSEAARNSFGKSGVCTSFLRHKEIYRPMDSRNMPRRLAHDRPRPPRYDEFPAGYSSARCAPAAPASASPAKVHFAGIGTASTIELQRTVNCLLTPWLTQGDNPGVPIDTLPTERKSTSGLRCSRARLCTVGHKNKSVNRVTAP